MSQGTEDEARSPLRRLWDELKRRRVVRTSLWYGGSVWALLQGADFLVDLLGVPEAVIRTLAVLALAAFPAVVVVSWSYDITSDEPGDEAPRSRAARGLVVAAGLLVSVAAAALLIRWIPMGGPPPAAPPPPTRVAILPLDAPRSEPELQQFAADLHQRLIDRISPTSDGVTGRAGADRLRVISRAGVLPFAGGEITTDSIGRALGVGTLVEGSVEASGGLARVRLRVIDAASSEVMATQVATADRNDLLALTDSVNSAVSSLRQALGGTIENRQRLLDTSDRRAYELIVEGQAVAADFDDAFRVGSVDRAAGLLAVADSLFAEAARRDRDWAEPVVERGLLTSDRVLVATNRGDAVEPIYRRGLALAEEALERDRESARGRFLRGVMRFELARLAPPGAADTLFEAAEADLRLAARTSARPAGAYRRLAELLATRGRYEEALQAGGRAYDEDPYLDEVQATLLRLFQYSLALDRDAEAARWCQEGARRFPDFPPFSDCLLVLRAWTDTFEPDADSAAALVRRELSTYPEPLRPRLAPRLQGLLAASLVRDGEPDSARAVLDAVRRSGDRSVGVRVTVAGVLLLLGETEAALATLDSLVAEAPEWRAELRAQPELRPLQGDPRFQALLDGGG